VGNRAPQVLGPNPRRLNLIKVDESVKKHSEHTPKHHRSQCGVNDNVPVNFVTANQCQLVLDSGTMTL